MQIRPGLMGFSLVLIVAALGPSGCKSVSLTEINGKSSFGPEWRNFGTNTHDVRYTGIQSVEAKLSNKWTLGMTCQVRSVDNGSGEDETLLLFEVGYPIWNAPKKPEKTADQIQIEELEKELRQLDTELAAAGVLMPGGVASALLQPGDNDQSFEKEKGE